MHAASLAMTNSTSRELGAVHLVVDGPWLSKALAATLFARTGRSPPQLRVAADGKLTASWSRPARRAAGFELDDGADQAELLILTARSLSPDVLCETDRRTADARPELLAIADLCWLATRPDRGSLLRAAHWMARQDAARVFGRCRRRVVVDARHGDQGLPDRTALQIMFRPAAVYIAASVNPVPDWLAAVA